MEIKCKSWNELLSLVDQKRNQEPLQLEWEDLIRRPGFAVKHTGDNPCTWVFGLVSLRESLPSMSLGMKELFKTPEGRQPIARYLQSGSGNLPERAV